MRQRPRSFQRSEQPVGLNPPIWLFEQLVLIHLISSLKPNKPTSLSRQLKVFLDDGFYPIFHPGLCCAHLRVKRSLRWLCKTFLRGIQFIQSLALAVCLISCISNFIALKLILILRWGFALQLIEIWNWWRVYFISRVILCMQSSCCGKFLGSEAHCFFQRLCVNIFNLRIQHLPSEILELIFGMGHLLMISSAAILLTQGEGGHWGLQRGHWLASEGLHG